MNDVQRKFDEISRQYNEQRRKFIPCFDDFYKIPVAVASAESRTPAILDVGAGTGLLSAALMERYPDGTYTLIDLSAGMMDKARERFHGIGNVQYIVDDYVTHEFGGPFDLIVSALSLHHLPDPLKEAMYAKCHALLRPGGILINADQVRGETPYIEAMNKQIWFQGIEASGLSADEIRSGYERIALDREAGLDEQLDWMRAAGFADVGCVFKYYHFAVLFGRKTI